MATGIGVLVGLLISVTLFLAGRISMMSRRHRHIWVTIIERAPTLIEDGLRTQRCNRCPAEAVAIAKWPGGKWHIIWIEEKP